MFLACLKKVSSNIRQRKASLVSNLSQKPKQSSIGEEENENDKATKQLRKQVTSPQIVVDHEDGTCNDDGPAAGLPGSSAIDEDKDDDGNYDDEYNVESSFPTRRTSRRSKKPVAENEKPLRKLKIADEKQAQKHEKTNEASVQPAKERPKKFSHSTRKKRRFVDKSLLHITEDEIDFAKVALKYIILFADYKEQLACSKTFHAENANNEENSLASEQDQGFTDDQVNSRAQSSSFCLNYQSYMDKEPTARWSKQDRIIL
ncbi:PREDICTED: uncharacterized protein LOC18594786 [Theobroma cacao]|uniref:Uncharacterized protein LOC18594786 n=1 Tax=Theobroma cacao TaxID=3641 RepID=A0AB32WLM8_THECC|nr:PREDICTED: uncharacterized protein LOC18594786 [Theobroma cacao]